VGNNALETLESGTFLNNSLLSLVLVENNHLDLYPALVIFLNTSLNLLDIEFCKSEEISLISYQNLPRLQELKRHRSELIDVRELVSEHTELVNVVISKLKDVGYGLDDYVYYNATSNQVTTSSDIPVFCYCDRISLWFWCSGTCASSRGLTHVYETLKCTKEYVKQVRNHTNSLDFHPDGETGLIVVYIPVTIVLIRIITVIIVIFRVKHKLKKAEEETGSLSAQNSFIFQNMLTDDNV
jgi:hypothetical protein